MTRLTFHLILHTHWDREWYLPRAGFQARLVPAVGDVLDLLDAEPDARFLLDGQTVLAEDALDVQPDWIPRVTEAVTDHRLEVGPWYILADEIIPSGESLVRNLLQGSRDAGALGARMNVLYSPDAFGHPAVFPSLANQFGIGAGVAWRGLGRPTGIDRDLYRWLGPDGAEVLLYHLPAAGYEVGADLRQWSNIRQQLVDRAGTSHVAVFVGADHHAPVRDPATIRDAIQAVESGNFVRLSSLAEFFEAARLEADAAPAITGELRWSYGHTWTLQGTHATRVRMKRRHTAIELYVQRQVEPLVALAAWHRGSDHRGLLRAATRTLLQCQFHDAICGCCNDLVAREQESRLTSVAAMATEIGRSAIHAITKHDSDVAREQPALVSPTLVLWNPVPRVRSGIVTAEVTCFRRDVLVGPPSGSQPQLGEGYGPFWLRGDSGETIPVQILSVRRGMERLDARRHYPDQDEVDVVRIAFDANPIAGMGFNGLRMMPGKRAAASRGLVVDHNRMENQFVTVLLSASGRIELIDRRSGERYVDVLALVDEPDAGDTYTPWTLGRTTDCSPAADVSATILAGGPLVGTLEQRWTAPSGARSVRRVLMLHADSPVLRVRLEIHNRAIDHRLRLRIPVGAGDVATSGAAFGFERRESVAFVEAEFPAEHPVRTAPAHRYVAAGSGNRGLALLCPGFFEYEWTKQHELFLTLVRSVGELSRSDLATRLGHAGWPMPTPDAQEPGRHVVELALAPLGDEEAEDIVSLEQMWEETHLPVQGMFARDFVGDTTALRTIGAELHGSGLIFTSLKPAENGPGILFRCYNVESANIAGCWTIQSGIDSATLVRADETPVASLDVRDGTTVRFTAPARSIVSILITASCSPDPESSPAP